MSLGGGGMKTAYVTGTVQTDAAGGSADPWSESHSQLANIEDVDRDLHRIYFRGHTGTDADTGGYECVVTDRAGFTPTDMYGVGAESPNNERDEVDATVLGHFSSSLVTSAVGAGQRYGVDPSVEFDPPYVWKEDAQLHFNVEVFGGDITEIRYIAIAYYT